MNTEPELLCGRTNLVLESNRRISKTFMRLSGGFKPMEDARDPIRRCADAVCDGFRQIGDFSYAILPRDVAHALGDLKKTVLTEIRNVVDWEIEWVGERVAGGDKLRDEWREKCHQNTTNDAASAPSA